MNKLLLIEIRFRIPKTDKICFIFLTILLLNWAVTHYFDFFFVKDLIL